MFQSADVINASDVEDIGAGQYLLVVFVIGVVVVSSVYFIFALNVELYRSFAHFMKVRRKVKAEKKAGKKKKKKKKTTMSSSCFGSRQSHVSDDDSDNGSDGVCGDGSASVSSSFFSTGPESKGSGEGGNRRSGSEFEYRSNPLRSPLRLRKTASTAGTAGGGANDDPPLTISSDTTGSTTSGDAEDGGDGERPTSEHVNPFHLAKQRSRMQKHTSSQRHASPRNSSSAANLLMTQKHSSISM